MGVVAEAALEDADESVAECSEGLVVEVTGGSVTVVDSFIGNASMSSVR